MSTTTATEVKPTKANIGVYTNPAHELGECAEWRGFEGG
jgi:hypothetical protein